MNKEVHIAIGLMSGTSLDGVDAVLLSSDGVNSLSRPQQFPISSYYLPYPTHVKAALQELIAGKREHLAIEREITILHAEAVKQLLSQAKITPEDVTVIGFHGQTIIHKPEEGITWQIGDGSLLCELTKISVVNDLRRRDLAMGGQGAPLLPIYHLALVKSYYFKKLKEMGDDLEGNIRSINEAHFPFAIINIGGVSNITYINNFHTSEKDIEIFAFDTGPGNALINDWVKSYGSLRREENGEEVDYDKDGDLAKEGKVHQQLVDQWLSHPYFSQTPPKSLDRNTFYTLLHGENEKFETMKGLSKQDGSATLTAFTIESIVKSSTLVKAPPKYWVITGGGRKNKFLLAKLQQTITEKIGTGLVKITEDFGWDGDMMEAEGFAYLAIRSMRSLPISLPSTTGCRSPVTGGSFHSYNTRLC